MAIVKLSDIPVGDSAKVVSITCDGLRRRRLMDLGIIPNTQIIVSRRSPLGDPRGYRVKGAEIALRIEEASEIMVERL